MKRKKEPKRKKDDLDRLLEREFKDPEYKRLYEIEGIKIRIGMRIAELRKKAGLTQGDLAKRIGVTQGFISQLEMADTENYELKTLKKISEAIGMVLVIGFVSKKEMKQKFAPMKELVSF